MNKNLLRKYIEGTCSKSELKEVFQYLETPAGQLEYEKLLDEEINSLDRPDYRKEIPLSLLSRLHENMGRDKRKSQKLVVFSIAASLLLVATLGVALFFLAGENNPLIFRSSEYVVESVPLGQREKISLSDGSVIWLNAGSTFRYPVQFSDSIREVFLAGEAYFDIAKDPDKPFIVHSSEISTRVLGTEFNIKAFPDEGIVAVSLVEGSVNVTDRSAKRSFTLLPNQQFFLQENRDGQIRNFDALQVTGWREGILIFDGQPLEQVASQLERHFGTSIEIANQDLRHCKIKGSFKNESLWNVLEVLRFTGDLRITPVRSEGKLQKVILSGEGCE